MSSQVGQEVHNHITSTTSGHVSEFIQPKYGCSKLSQGLGQDMTLQVAPSPLHAVFAMVKILSKHW